MVAYIGLLGMLGWFTVATATADQGRGVDQDTLPVLLLALGLPAVGMVVGSFYLRAWLLRTRLARLPRRIDGSQLAALTRAMLMPWVVSWYLCDLVAALGLVLFSFTGQWLLFLPFVGLAALGMILQPPSLNGFVRAVDDATGQRRGMG